MCILDMRFSSYHLPSMRTSEHSKHTIETRFPDSGYVGTASFLFLRFFVAAIVAPQGFGLTRRTLTPRVRWNAPGRHLIDVDGSP